MALFNNHVHISQMQALTANSWSIANKPLSLGGFGFFPKFELAPGVSLVLQLDPKSGLLPWIFSWIKPKKMMQALSTDGQPTWVSTIPWYYKLSHKVKGIYIQSKRRDVLRIEHHINEHGLTKTYTYQVNISANVAPERFFSFLLMSADNSETLLAALQNRITEVIAEVLIENLNPSFITHTKIKHEVLEEAGYEVEDCRIQYVN